MADRHEPSFLRWALLSDVTEYASAVLAGALACLVAVVVLGDGEALGLDEVVVLVEETTGGAAGALDVAVPAGVTAQPDNKAVVPARHTTRARQLCITMVLPSFGVEVRIVRAK